MKTKKISNAKRMLYKGKEHVVFSWKVNEETGTHEVVTDKGVLHLTSKQFVDDLVPVDHQHRTLAMEITREDYSELRELSAIVMASVKKLQTDATFVDQAHAINEGAKVLIDTKRLVIDAYRVMKDLE